MRKNFLGATTLALLIGVSSFTLHTALAQNGGEARGNDREMKKSLDDKHLTPIRPIRRVGDDNWPAATDQPAPVRETTGQSAKQDAGQEGSKQDTAQNTSKPDAKQSQNPNLGNQAPPPDKQDTAKSDSKPQDAAKNGDRDGKNDDKGFASIRLGTDESGRVAVNDSQEKQITKVIRKQHVDTVNVKVSVGSVAPANAKLVPVSSDFVDIMPQFRGYSYFATREEIVIVEPSSRKVVALIPVSLTATATGPGDERSTRSETRRTETKTTSRTRERDVTVGRSARSDGFPSREEILAAPVVRERSAVRSYRYYEPDDDVVIIERRRPRIFGFW